MLEFNHRAGMATIQDIIADCLKIHPEFIIVTDEPITMKYNEDDRLYYTSFPCENYKDLFQISVRLEDKVIHDDGESYVEDADVVFVEDRDLSLDRIYVYKKAKGASVIKKFKDEIESLKYRRKRMTWEDKFYYHDGEYDTMAELVSEELNIPREYIYAYSNPLSAPINFENEKHMCFAHPKYESDDHKEYEDAPIIMYLDTVKEKVGNKTKLKSVLESVHIWIGAKISECKDFSNRIHNFLKSDDNGEFI